MSHHASGPNFGFPRGDAGTRGKLEPAGFTNVNPRLDFSASVFIAKLNVLLASLIPAGRK